MADATSSSSGGGDPPHVTELDSVVIRFVGDSGDGMQLTGTEFTRAAAIDGNDIATFPDYPAEIRAPAGSLAGVSGFQLQFSSSDIFTAGDAPDVLVAMNPAALKRNVGELVPGGLLIVDSGTFKAKNLQLAGYASNPLEDGTLKNLRVVPIDITRQVAVAHQGSGLSTKEVARTRNFYALGLVFWLYGRDPAPEVESIRRRFARRAAVAEANVRAFEAGYAYGETTELFVSTYRVPPARLEPGTYRNVTGNEAIALGLIAASLLSERHLLYASYPITPASDVLHYLSAQRHYGLTTFQAEDEIAAVTAAIGAAFGGALGVTGTSGPGFSLKQEGIGLAVMAELPLVVINVQRAGPSTGMPTKPEQADLLQTLFGRHGEAPVAIVAPATPADCFEMVIEAARIAFSSMCPVVCLSDALLANGAEPWRLPDPAALPRIDVRLRTEPEGFAPYLRDERTLGRVWAVPGTPGLEHRIGGLEKEELTGNVSYAPENHEYMVRLREEKIERVAETIPEAEVYGDPEGELLLVGWGGTFGAIRQATRALRAQDHAVSHLHLRYLNPLQRNVGEALASFPNVLVIELNHGHLRSILRSRFMIEAKGLNKIQGVPFRVSEIVEAARQVLGVKRSQELRA
jgi:2-oxoglutarate ferredoxin oxidoreductase subunit alpha